MVACERRQLSYVELPLIQIVPVPVDQLHKQLVMDLDQFDVLIFISTNAVAFGMALIDQYWPQLPRLNWFAVGAATAEELGNWGQLAVAPEVPGSEGLLALPSLQNLDQQKVMIVKGEGGRTLLTETLIERGATVTELPVYQREPVPYSIGQLSKIFTPGTLGYVIITSGESAEQFDELCPSTLREQLVLIVPSARVAEIARGRGYTQVIDAGSPEAEDMVACIE